ncbi:unnamed protein product [Brachionus calyciflorus]|uniref:Fuzzy n=1 Tax=Brachionus calyciflorus TaxID=104777 RepID=A0A814QG37_9BILA|nr:unnamed protein product [Brachionus calyciflorus]
MSKEDSNLINSFICLKSQDGIPLFTRSCNGSKELPFQIIGTLNSIFTIGDKYGFRLDSLDSTEFKIIWKMYQSNITLILIESIEPVDESFYFRKLDILFDALVLMYGLEDLINISNVEKFKKEIKIAFPLIDLILNSSSNFDLFGGYITNTVDLILDLYETNDIVSYQTALQASCQEVNTSYACILINGRVVTASPSWWEFKPAESFLISVLCMTLSKATSCDTPIYLPYKNPSQPLRFLTFNLCPNITLCFICSEKPSIDKAEEVVKRLWHPIYKSLVNLKLCLPRNLPNHITVDQNMIS